MTALGRSGKGVLVIVASGNGDASGNALDIEPTPNQFINEYASSNKVLIVGATAVNDNYNWLTGSPTANEKLQVIVIMETELIFVPQLGVVVLLTKVKIQLLLRQ